MLLDLLFDWSSCAFLFPLVKEARSVVIFSWPISRDEGTCDNDFLDFGREAGNVTSFRDAIFPAGKAIVRR